MGCACLKLEAADPWQEISQVMHQGLDDWLEGLRSRVERTEGVSLRELSELFLETRGALLGPCLASLAQGLHGHYREQRQALCPGCGTTLNRKRVDPRTVATLQGPVTLERPYFYCRDCRIGFHPLDAALGLAEEAHQYDLQDRLTQVSARLPYAESAALFHELTGLKVSNHLGHETLNRLAEAATLETVIPSREEIERRIEAAKASPEDRPVLVVASQRRLCAYPPQGPAQGQAWAWRVEGGEGV
jgi:hypothetical protein